jgi:hypothetical protein
MHQEHAIIDRLEARVIIVLLAFCNRGNNLLRDQGTANGWLASRPAMAIFAACRS